VDTGNNNNQRVPKNNYYEGYFSVVVEIEKSEPTIGSADQLYPGQNPGF
jgi:hypothetical protein